MSDFQPPEPFVTTEEIAAFISKPVSWVHVNTKKVGMPHYKIGQHYRYRISEVMDWIESGEAAKITAGHPRSKPSRNRAA